MFNRKLNAMKNKEIIGGFEGSIVAENGGDGAKAGMNRLPSIKMLTTAIG
jgi:hypothetical protein